MNLRQLPLFFAGLCLFMITPALADEPGELKEIRFEFQVRLAGMVKPLRELDGKYAAHLEKQKQSYKSAGNLKALLAMDGELKWLKNKPVEENPSQGQPLSAIPELKRLQEVYRQQWAVVAETSASPDKKLALIQFYRKKAGDLATGWTKEGKIEEAKQALAESERFAAMEKDAGLAAKAGQTTASGPAMGTGNDFGGKTTGEEMKNGIRMQLCWIPAGKFTMGSSPDEPERNGGQEAQVEVELTHGFWLGKYEVTQEEYEKITGSNPSKFTEVGEKAPVDQVSWGEAVVFCEKLGERERKRGKLPEGWSYSLPTEAQWEYACRAGGKGLYAGGKLDEVGWYKGNGGGRNHEVGGKKANAWGLHDMHGNVQEWCLDWGGGKLSGGKDPTGPTSGSDHVIRGGNWDNQASDCRSARRGWGQPADRNNKLGFRVCLGPTQKNK